MPERSCPPLPTGVWTGSAAPGKSGSSFPLCGSERVFPIHAGSYKILQFGGLPLSLRIKLNTVHPDKSHIPRPLGGWAPPPTPLGSGPSCREKRRRRWPRTREVQASWHAAGSCCKRPVPSRHHGSKNRLSFLKEQQTEFRMFLNPQTSLVCTYLKRVIWSVFTRARPGKLHGHAAAVSLSPSRVLERPSRVFLPPPLGAVAEVPRPRIRGLALPFDRNGMLHLVPSAWLVPRGMRVRDSPASLHSSALHSLSLPSGVRPVDTPQATRAPVGGRQGHCPFSGAAGCCERLRTSPTGLCFCFSRGKNQRLKWPANFFKNCQPQFSKVAVPLYLPASNA